jgi:hypothetical protein
MDAVDLILRWLSPILAIVYVLGYSLIFDPVRKWKRLPKFFRDLLGCPMCIGWWAGVAVGLVNWAPIVWPPWLRDAALGGCLAVSAEYLLELFARE